MIRLQYLIVGRGECIVDALTVSEQSSGAMFSMLVHRHGVAMTTSHLLILFHVVMDHALLELTDSISSLLHITRVGFFVGTFVGHDDSLVGGTVKSKMMNELEIVERVPGGTRAKRS